MDHWHRAKQLFLEATKLPETERSDFLREECGDDDELRAQVEELLSEDTMSGDRGSATNPNENPAGGATVPWSARAPEEDLRQVDKYRILETVGEGGLGTVYLAEEREPVVRKVALKVIKRGMDTKEVIARFEQEHQALTLMNHPAIARVYDAGVTPGGRPYFVMEYVPGVPITEYADRERLTLDQRLSLFQEVCRGVQHAHQKAVIHRDLKPGNILVMMLDDHPQPKIIDFGVAKATAQRLTEKTLHTEVGQIIGTPEYMAPEQADLSAVDIDTRSDVYSLGVLLYELLVGCLPFDGRDLRQAGYAEMQRIIKEEDPPRPSTRITAVGAESTVLARNRYSDARTLISALRGDLDWITMKALEKERARRYSSATELAADIQRYRDFEPVVARPPSIAYRTNRFVRRYRGPVLGAVAVLVALVTGLSWALNERARATDMAQQAQQARKLAEANELRANQNAEEARRQRERADRVAKAAMKQRLGDLKLAEDYEIEATTLWPAHPKTVPALEAWLRKSRVLVERLGTHEQALRELAERAIPGTVVETDADYLSSRGRVVHLERMLRIVERGKPEPYLVLDPATMPKHAEGLNNEAWTRVGPKRTLFGEELVGLAYAEEAARLAPTNPDALDTLAWGKALVGALWRGDPGVHAGNRSSATPSQASTRRVS